MEGQLASGIESIIYWLGLDIVPRNIVDRWYQKLNKKTVTTLSTIIVRNCYWQVHNRQKSYMKFSLQMREKETEQEVCSISNLMYRVSTSSAVLIGLIAQNQYTIMLAVTK